MSGLFSPAVRMTPAGTVQQPRFEGGATDDSDTPDASFRVVRQLTNATTASGHGFRDQTDFQRGAGSSYCAYDSQIKLSGGDNHDHVVAFQSRPDILNTAGTLTHCYGLFHGPNINGAGTVVNSYGLYAANPIGSGVVQFVYGFYIAQQTRGSVQNYAGYIAQQAAPLWCGAPLVVNNLVTIGTAPLIAGGATPTSYPYLGYNFDPVNVVYKTADVATAFKFDANGIALLTAPAGAAGAACAPVERWRITTAGDAITVLNAAMPTLTISGQMSFALTSNTNLRIAVRGSDGVTRVANLALA